MDQELEMSDFCYLDNAGSPIPSKQLISAIFDDISATNLSNPFSNPHSNNIGKSAHAISESRKLILSFLNLEYDDYDVIFTAGSTASIKLMCDIFPWEEESKLCYPYNSHTSLLGSRSFCKQPFVCSSASLRKPFEGCDINSRIDREDISSMNGGREDEKQSKQSSCSHLLLVPGECNFSGLKADLFTIAKLISQSEGKSGDILIKELDARRVSPSTSCIRENVPSKWFWCLDAAKLAATSALDLGFNSHPELKPFRPHFICVSFYKIFGYPTGLGALLIRRDMEPLIRKNYFGGGTLAAAAADTMFSARKAGNMHDYLEDGTPNFYAIAALPRCFEFIRNLGGMEVIQARTFRLTSYLAREMTALRHSSGLPLCTLYGEHGSASLERQGPVIAFNLQWRSGEAIGFAEVARLAQSHRIYLRAGCFCNVGACQEWLELSAEEMEENYRHGRVCGTDSHDVVNGRNTGAVRVSLGFNSTERDCDLLLTFLKESYLNKEPEVRKLRYSLEAMRSISSDDVFLYEEENCERDIDSIVQRSDPFNDDPVSGSSPDASLSPNTDLGPSKGSLLLSGIFVYPIKSCGGMRVSAWPLSPSGLLYDRQWTIVDSSGRAITQKSHPRLSLVRASIDLRSQLLIVRAPYEWNKKTLIIPIDGNNTDPQEGEGVTIAKEEAVSVNICGISRDGWTVSTDADQWFSEVLSDELPTALTPSTPSPPCSPSRLSPAPASSPHRGRKYRLIGRGQRGGESCSRESFSNKAPFLLITEESVRALVALISAEAAAAVRAGETSVKLGKIRVENFRPNLLLSGAECPHDEDSWESITFEDSHLGPSQFTSPSSPSHLQLAVSGPCPRCSMVNVDGTSGSFDCRAFEALAEYRKKGREVHFGQFVSYSAGSPIDVHKNSIIGVLKVGGIVNFKRKDSSQVG